MLEKPDLSDEKIVACLRNAYGMEADQLAFLPVGADVNAAVYRAVTAAVTAYFVKLRRGPFDETAVALPKYLSDQGVPQIIPPLPANNGCLWTTLDDFKVILYRFVEGGNGYEVALTEAHWRTLGTALKRIHTTTFSPALTSAIAREAYSAQWRTSVKNFLAQTAVETFTEPVAQQAAQLLQSNRTTILELIARTEQLAQQLQKQPLTYTVCHTDLHAGNFLIDAGGFLYIVDWDAPLWAPKERDLMFAGGGLGGGWHKPETEEAFFYQGYGPTEVNPTALAYYRYERIIQDIAAFCEQLLLTDEGGDDRPQSLRYLASNFGPDGVLAIAMRADQTNWASMYVS
ncbi:MAG: aminoglycoside phosphotransferase family protein [Caldilinea sp. CFX5]|nr:aminoglycoside phosphotransferase family protein [Caldilinea sp. CFX5]